MRGNARATNTALDLVAKGVAKSRAARLAGVSVSTINRALARIGLPRPPPGRPPNPTAQTR